MHVPLLCNQVPAHLKITPALESAGWRAFVSSVTKGRQTIAQCCMELQPDATHNTVNVGFVQSWEIQTIQYARVTLCSKANVS